MQKSVGYSLNQYLERQKKVPVYSEKTQATRRSDSARQGWVTRRTNLAACSHLTGGVTGGMTNGNDKE